mgnify:CR=1 FL=1
MEKKQNWRSKLDVVYVTDLVIERQKLHALSALRLFVLVIGLMFAFIVTNKIINIYYFIKITFLMKFCFFFKCTYKGN